MRARHALTAACAALLLAACSAGEQAAPAQPGAEGAPAPVADGAEGETATPPATTDEAAQPSADSTDSAQVEAPGSPTPANPPSDSSARDARLDGFGPLRLGMTTAEAEAAWPGLFEGMANATSRNSCFHVSGGLSHFGMMFDGGRFVRYGGSNDDIAAPGGGRRGMPEAELQALYKNALDVRQDPQVKARKWLTLDTSGVAPSRLVFVLRQDNTVNEWLVGLRPQIDYDAGCEDAG